jgi:hypothetical protein
MENSYPNSSSAGRPFSSCWGCGAEIMFDRTVASKSGKLIPLDTKDGRKHQCPNRQRNRTPNAGSGNDRSIMSEQVDKLLQSQQELKMEVKTGLEHVEQRLNYLQTELQRLTKEAGP